MQGTSSRWMRRLPAATWRLTQSENASLTWRIIAGGTRPGEAHGLLRAWLLWERVARFMWPVCEIPGAPYGLLCFRIMPYRGEPLVLPDTTTVRPGAILGELHCNNRAILELVSQHGNPFAAFRKDLKSLSNWILQERLGHQIEAIYARTILTSLAYRLGFTVRQEPVTLRRRLEKFFFKGLLLLYNQEGLARIQHGSTADTYPADVWLSRRELLRLYHDHSEPGRRPISQSTGPASVRLTRRC
jgi:peptidoglycan-N-acetylglucosamine deacetylase